VSNRLNQVTERAYALCGGDIKRIAPPAFTRNRRAKMRA